MKVRFNHRALVQHRLTRQTPKTEDALACECRDTIQALLDRHAAIRNIYNAGPAIVATMADPLFESIVASIKPSEWQHMTAEMLSSPEPEASPLDCYREALASVDCFERALDNWGDVETAVAKRKCASKELLHIMANPDFNKIWTRFVDSGRWAEEVRKRRPHEPRKKNTQNIGEDVLLELGSNPNPEFWRGFGNYFESEAKDSTADEVFPDDRDDDVEVFPDDD